MPFRFLAVFISCGLAACEHIDELAEVGGPQMPPATAEAQRINIDELGPKVVRHTGVAPVRVTPLADPQYPLPRAQTVAFEDAPPPAPTRLTEAGQWFDALSAVDRKTVREICRERRKDPCFGILPEPQPLHSLASPGNAPATRMQQLLGQLGPREIMWTVHSYCRERDPSIVCDTPLVVSFDEAPVAFEASRAAFAFQPGVPVTSDFPSAKTPWIALDRDGDGAITSGAELFGDATVLPDGSTATNGFAALAALDANGDGVIDRHDPRFAQLVLWADRDGDRKSSPAELRPLAEIIISIPLDHEIVPRCVRGNCEGERGVMTWGERGQPRTGAVIDVYLRRR